MPDGGERDRYPPPSDSHSLFLLEGLEKLPDVHPVVMEDFPALQVYREAGPPEKRAFAFVTYDILVYEPVFSDFEGPARRGRSVRTVEHDLGKLCHAGV